MSDASVIAREFIARINAHDARALAELMTEDHRVVDATDGIIVGRRTLRQGWESFFAMFPDYVIELEDIIASGDVVALFGHASGHFSGAPPQGASPSFRIPLAWRAVIREGLVAEWRIYGDVEPMLRAAGGGRFFPGPSG